MTLFGTAYYPEYIPVDRIEQDIAMMQRAGMNVIRIAESTWSTLEPKKDKFNFDYIDRTLAAALKADMKVIIGTPTYAIPAWLLREDPEVMADWQSGRAQYGHRQMYDLSNPTYRTRSEIVIRKLMEHVANHPSVIGYQIDNETKHYGNFSAGMQKLFVDYLKKKYKTTNALNKAFYLNYWSNSIHSWEDFPDMKGCCNGGLEAEYQLFIREYAAEFLHWEVEIVKAYARADQFITHNFDYSWRAVSVEPSQAGYSYCIQDDMAQAKAAEAMTLVGTDIYHPTGSHLTGCEQSMAGDIMRNLKGESRNYLILETEAQAYKYFTTYPNQLQLHAVTNFANGALGQLYWHWHSIANGYETYWRGVLDHAFKETPTYWDALEIGKLLAEQGETMTVAKTADVLIVSDVHSKKAFNYFPMDKDLNYDKVFRWIYDVIYEKNIQTDIVDYTLITAEKLAQYKAVVVPALYSADKAFCKMLSNYVKKGGTLLSTFTSFRADRHLSAHVADQPAYMTDCFGVTYQRFIDPEKTKVGGKKTECFAELLTLRGARSLYNYENKYWKAYAAITENTYGNGKAYYIGAYVHDSVLAEVVEEALGAYAQATLKDASFPCIVKTGVNTAGEKLHYILNFSDEELETDALRVDGTNLLTGESYMKGDKLTLREWGFIIIKEG